MKGRRNAADLAPQPSTDGTHSRTAALRWAADPDRGTLLEKVPLRVKLVPEPKINGATVRRLLIDDLEFERWLFTSQRERGERIREVGPQVRRAYARAKIKRDTLRLPHAQKEMGYRGSDCRRLQSPKGNGWVVNLGGDGALRVGWEGTKAKDRRAVLAPRG